MNGVYVPFQYANCSSTCSWKLQSKPRGGHELQIMTLDGMKYAGWAIKSVILTDDWQKMTKVWIWPRTSSFDLSVP